MGFDSPAMDPHELTGAIRPVNDYN